MDVNIYVFYKSFIIKGILNADKDDEINIKFGFIPITPIKI